MKLFEIVVAGQRFAVAREPGGANHFYQTYYVDGRDVPVQHYLKMIAMAMGIDGDSVGQGPPRVARDVRGREASRTTSH